MYEKLYSQITDALSKELLSALQNEAKHEKDFKRAEISGAGDLHLDNSRRTDKIHWLTRDGDAQADF